MEIKKLAKTTATLSLLVLLSSTYANAQAFNNLTDCLVTNDIGKYTYKLDRSFMMEKGSGIVGAADHFDLDHSDKLCDGGYSNINEVRGLPKEEKFKKLLSVKVQVTQHTGGDSDRWLLHEIEDSLRDGDDGDSRLGLFSGAGVKIREINGNKILYWGLGGGSYIWVSGQKVIEMKYTDLQRNKPEPIEVVKAYLQKFTSTVTTTDAEFKSTAYNVKWIKDEIDRRLWLCDKWNAQFQAGGVTQADLIYNLVRSMEVFLNYRQKYYGVSAKDDIAAIGGYMRNDDIASIQTKLSEYKGWWSSNKARSISLP